MGADFIIGCVGKPSAGKSTFFNAATEGTTAKVGNYPFTTINPNEGVGIYSVPCPCAEYGVRCQPVYGRCVRGVRGIPVRLLDVAGLIPGANEGRGLGCKFLDDLRCAHVLLHIIDVSGNTNEKGEATTGYDPSLDHQWLVEEIQLWIFNNIWSRWSSIARRHSATSSSLEETFGAQLSGYGASREVICSAVAEFQKSRKTRAEAVASSAVSTFASDQLQCAAQEAAAELVVEKDLSKWGADDVMEFVKTFVQMRFPFVLVLNKCDAGGEVDANVMKISKRFPGQPLVLCSALAECFLQRLKQQKVADYDPFNGKVLTVADSSGAGARFLSESEKASVAALKPIDAKASARLDRVKDIMLFRHGGTGVQKALRAAVELQGHRFPVFPVRTLNLASEDKKGRGPFNHCVLVEEGTTVGKFASSILGIKGFLYAEAPDGRRVGEEDLVQSLPGKFKILKIVNDANA